MALSPNAVVSASKLLMEDCLLSLTDRLFEGVSSAEGFKLRDASALNEKLANKIPAATEVSNFERIESTFIVNPLKLN